MIFDELNQNVNIDGYYFDTQKTIHKYKLEDKDGKLCIPKLQNYKGTEKYELVKKEWKIIQDVKDNNFKPLVNQVIYYIWKDIPDENELFKYVWEDIETKLSKNKEVSSFLITARAGCGKSHLIKQIQAELDENETDYVTIGPTNKSCI